MEYYFHVKEDEIKSKNLIETSLKLLLDPSNIVLKQEEYYYQFILGYLYYHGIGIEVNDKIAYDYFMKSCDGKCALAQCYVGHCYE